MSDKGFSLDDKYTVREGRVHLTGIQALVRLPVEQYRRDQEAGLRVGTYISGYQGSPLGELDKQLKLARKVLDKHDVVWKAGINEDVAATAVYGTQMLEKFPHERFDGITGIWYGKGPGVDRTGDAFRHAGYVGTSRYGAALALAGDDPACKSSTIPSDSTVAFYDLSFPLLFPSDPKEMLEMGLHGIAMSRYSGLWSAMKIVTNVADGGAIVDIHPEMAVARIPEFEIDGEIFAKKQDMRLLPPFTVEVERQIHYERMLGAMAYVRTNKLDRIVVRGPKDRIGLVSSGKSYLDLMLALNMLGLDEHALHEAGVRIYKLGVIAPIEPQGLAEFAEGLEQILVIEEKRGFSETLIRDALYNGPHHPLVYGKRDEAGRPLFPIHSEMDAEQIALLLGAYLQRRLGRSDLLPRIGRVQEIAARQYGPVMPRTPFFCSGCPHNTSTRVPEGEIAGGGIGCHAMASYMEDRGITWLTHMGGEGGPWLGLAPFTEREHMFQNVGDGTYAHSASKSVQASIAGGVNMTYKLLYNNAVAMTGGQQVMGQRAPTQLAEGLISEGARRVVIVPEQIERYPKRKISDKITVRPKDEYNQVMLELREEKGVTVIIFDQQCAAEKRRQRKRGLLDTPPRRVFINESVCEGCGDCGVKSSCMSVVPVQTDYGRKTQIHLSSCNFDYSCMKGDCPAFMTVELGPDTKPARRKGLATQLPANLPEPAHKATSARPYKAMMIGVGGTGVVTVDALLVTAALLDGKYAVHLDQTGLAQKGGAVLSNLIISDQPFEQANKIAAGEADLVVSFDILATVAPDNLNRFHPERTVAVANTAQISTAAVVTDRHQQLPTQARLQARLDTYTNKSRNVYLDAVGISEALFGDHMSNNIFMVGVAYQHGLLPLAASAVEEAITVNGVAVEQNHSAFRWGRQYVIDQQSVLGLLDDEQRGGPSTAPREAAVGRLRRHAPKLLGGFEALVARFPKGERLADILYPRVADLMLYQNPRTAREYLDFVQRVADAEQERTAGRTELREEAARWLFKLIAVKDEYEVARLWLQDPAWERAAARFEGSLKRYVHLHPPALRRLGMKNKLRIGVGAQTLFRLLYGLRGLRGTALDLFGRGPHRHLERALAGWYQELLAQVLPTLTHENHAAAVALAKVPDGIRGYEALKERNVAEAKDEAQRLLEAFRGSPGISQEAGD